MTGSEIKQLFKLVLSGWATQRSRLDEGDIANMTKLYTAGLMDLDYGVAEAAVIRIVHTSKFLPTVAEIREAAGVVKHGNQRTGMEAWGEVLQKIRTFGLRRDSTPTRGEFFFADPITERVVLAMNWEVLCAGEGDQITADRARFIAAYDRIAETERSNAASSPNMASPMFELRTQPPAKALAASRSISTPEERSKLLEEVIATVRQSNPGMLDPLLGPAKLALVPDETCECIEMYDPLGYQDRCPNCGLTDTRERKDVG